MDVFEMKKFAVVFSIIMCMLACTKPSDDKKFICSMYEESLYEDYTFLEQHCSKDLLAKLSEEYDYEGGGYAVWKFRSGAQDGPSNEHAMKSIEDEGDGWYRYTAVDMGITFTKRIRLSHKDGKNIIEDVVDTTPEESNPFEEFTALFSETASFAYANVNGYNALLVSEETFGNDADEEKEAIEATIFVLDSKGKVMTLGSIRSQGTLYPVSLLDGKLMVAGHQFVRIYSIRGDIPELYLDSYWEGEDPEQTDMFKTFEMGTSIKFKKLKPNV